MRKLIYCLWAITILAVGCKKNNSPETTNDPEAKIEFCFGEHSVEITDHEAIITFDDPRILVNGYEFEYEDVYVEYCIYGDEENTFKIEEYKHKDKDHLIFIIENLLAETTFQGFFIVDGGRLGTERYEFDFTTLEHAPDVYTNYQCDIDAKGLFATLSFSDITYSLDGEPLDLKSVTFEYNVDHSNATTEWITHQLAGDNIVDGKLTIELPMDGDEYLIRREQYKYRLTLTPQNKEYEPYTFIPRTFKTIGADVEAQFSTPIVSYSNDDAVVNIESMELYYDGVSIDDYSASPTFGLMFRTKGEDEWERLPAYRNEGGLQGVVYKSLLSSNTTYEVKATIIDHTEDIQLDSEVVEFTTGEISTTPNPDHSIFEAVMTSAERKPSSDYGYEENIFMLTFADETGNITVDVAVVGAAGDTVLHSGEYYSENGLILLDKCRVAISDSNAEYTSFVYAGVGLRIAGPNYMIEIALSDENERLYYFYYEGPITNM